MDSPDKQMPLLPIVMPVDVFMRFVEGTKILFKIVTATPTELSEVSNDDLLGRVNRMSVDVARGIWEIWESPQQFHEDIQILLAAGKKVVREKSQ